LSQKTRNTAEIIQLAIIRCLCNSTQQ